MNLSSPKKGKAERDMPCVLLACDFFLGKKQFNNLNNSVLKAKSSVCYATCSYLEKLVIGVFYTGNL